MTQAGKSPFETLTDGSRSLIGRTEWLADLQRAGLDQPETWIRSLGDAHAGRGASGFMEVPQVGRLHLKQMRRGGLTAALWRDRYPGRSRLVANLELSERAFRAGIPTPRPAALLLVEGPVGLYRGWYATQAVERARDWWSYLREDVVPRAAHLSAAMRGVARMHDAGLYHADLNLGNLLLREEKSDSWAEWVIDLDRSRFLAGPLGSTARAKQLDRMERFYRKHLTHDPAVVQEFRRQMDEHYARVCSDVS